MIKYNDTKDMEIVTEEDDSQIELRAKAYMQFEQWELFIHSETSSFGEDAKASLEVLNAMNKFYKILKESK